MNALVDPIFKKPPIRNYSGELEDVIGDFLHDTDGSGTDMGTMMKQAAIMAKVYGISFIVVDMPREPMARNMAELAQQRAYPYHVLMITCSLDVRLNTTAVSELRPSSL